MPSPTDDNSWDDVYAELGIEVPKPKPAVEPAPALPRTEEEVSFEETPAETWPDEVPPLPLLAVMKEGFSCCELCTGIPPTTQGLALDCCDWK